jgi:putative membrane protein
MLTYALLVLKGMVYGVTNLLPGIGGGLILIILGIYEQFVDHVGNFFLDLRRWKQHLAFLIPMGLGAAMGMVAFASAIKWLMGLYPAPAMFLFMGLVVGTIPAVLHMHSDMRLTPGRAVALMCGIALVVLFKWAENHSVSAGWSTDPKQASGFVYYLLSNFVAGGASVTPGMDGSYIWMLAGIFDGVMGAISSVKEVRQVLGAGGFGAALAGIQWAALFATGIGAVAGIIIISKLIDTAIKRAASVTYYVVLGLVVASVYGLWPKPEELAQASIVVMALAFGAGAALTWFLGRKETQQEEASPPLA